MKYSRLLLPMRSFLFLAAFSFGGMIAQKQLPEITHWWSVLASAINLITIAVLLILCKCRNTTYWKMLHYEKQQKGFVRGFAFIIMMLLIGMGGMYLAGAVCYGTFPYLAPMMIAPVHPYLALLNILILPFTTTIAEDGVYLGYGVNSFSSKWAAILVPAFFYALQHSFIPTIMDARFMIYRFLSFLPLTIWVCCQYYKNGSIAYIMAGHWFLNIATTIQIAITSFHPESYAALLKQ